MLGACNCGRALLVGTTCATIRADAMPTLQACGHVQNHPRMYTANPGLPTPRPCPHPSMAPRLPPNLPNPMAPWIRVPSRSSSAASRHPAQRTDLQVRSACIWRRRSNIPKRHHRSTTNHRSRQCNGSDLGSRRLSRSVHTVSRSRGMRRHCRNHLRVHRTADYVAAAAAGATAMSIKPAADAARASALTKPPTVKRPPVGRPARVLARPSRRGGREKPNRAFRCCSCSVDMGNR